MKSHLFPGRDTLESTRFGFPSVGIRTQLRCSYGVDLLPTAYEVISVLQECRVVHQPKHFCAIA